jgi:DNA-binding PadR family transcriptional regulator
MDQHSNNRISPEFVLLGYLYRAPGHGYDLHKRMTDQFGNIWHSSQSQTYSILKRMADKGYVSTTLVEQANLPSRQLLHISAAGIKRFESWLNDPTSCSVHAIRVEFITRLYFMQLYHPAEVAIMIARQAEVVSAGIVKLEAMKTALPGDQAFNRLALELRIKLLDAVLDWLNDCVPFIGGLGKANEFG